MRTILNHNINNYTISFNLHSLEDITNSKRKFNGQKVLHPYNFKKIKKDIEFKRRGKIIKKTMMENIYKNEPINDTIEEELKNSYCELKHDGQCGYIFYDKNTNQFIPYARFDIKKKDGKFAEPKPNWIPCESKPTNENATHFPHFRPCSEDPKNYKYLISAFQTFKDSKKLKNIKSSFTVEYMGKKTNFCKTDPIFEDCYIIPHGSISIDIPEELKTFDGFRTIFQQLGFIEGIVLYTNNNVYKIRRDMFLDENNEKMRWGDTDINDFKDITNFEDDKGLSSFCL